MDKKIAQQLANLYSRHNSLMNLIRALEEYTRQPNVAMDIPMRRESITRRVRRTRTRHLAA